MVEWLGCGFENEYFDYISKTGEINERMYNKIVNNILKGACPHVGMVDDMYTREGSIYAIHIAAAVGTEGAIKDYLNNYREVFGGLFKLTPYRIAVIREKLNVVSLFQGTIQTIFSNPVVAINLINSYRSSEDKNRIMVEQVSVPLYCIRKKNRELLKSVLNPFIQYVNVNKAFEMVFKCNLRQMQGDLIQYLQEVHVSSSDTFLRDCCVSAIVYNQASVLDSILTPYMSNPSISSALQLAETCSALKRNVCADILHEHGITRAKDQAFHPQSRLFLLLKTFHDEFKEEIMSRLRETVNIHGVINIKYRNGMTRLHSCVGPYHQIDPCEVRALLELGADVDIVDDKGNTPLVHLLSKRSHIKGIRESIEMFLNENPSTSLNKDAVALAIELDEQLEETKFVRDITGEYVIDCEEHSMFDSTAYAFNFLGPLLIECGFPYTRDTLVASRDKSLHNAEHAYLCQCLNNPRSLKLRCRDVIRNYYKRKQLNHFLESAILPSKIKEFISLKEISTLQTIFNHHHN